MKTSLLPKRKWISRWAGSYTFISSSYWASQYANSLKRILGKGLETTIFVHKKGVVSFFVCEDELTQFGNHCAQKVKANKNETAKLLGQLKDNSDVMLSLMSSIQNRAMTIEEYNPFLFIFDRHLAFHNFMKKTVDFLDAETLSKVITDFVDARKYSESVYSKTEEFFRKQAQCISALTNYKSELLICLTQNEFEDFLRDKKLPSKEVLQSRYECSAIIFANGTMSIVTGSAATEIEQQLFAKKSDQIQGTCAYPGKIVGRVRIVLDPSKALEFNDGDILITGMTRPEFTQFMQKAGAIVTDVGGMLCHAAITAREMKIPCVIGTANATKILKDGDMIEVDAVKGIIKKF